MADEGRQLVASWRKGRDNAKRRPRPSHGALHRIGARDATRRLCDPDPRPVPQLQPTDKVAIDWTEQADEGALLQAGAGDLQGQRAARRRNPDRTMAQSEVHELNRARPASSTPCCPQAPPYPPASARG